jgi:hypothetical protein
MLRYPFLPLLLIFLAVPAGCGQYLPSRNPGSDSATQPVKSRLSNRGAIAKLLPPDVQLNTVADCEYGGAKKITVEDELIRVQARVGEDGKLQDGRGKPIHFFKLIGCWGNPPANYQQILDEENRRLDELRKTHTVITLTCNPTGMPIP